MRFWLSGPTLPGGFRPGVSVGSYEFRRRRPIAPVAIEPPVLPRDADDPAAVERVYDAFQRLSAEDRHDLLWRIIRSPRRGQVWP